MAIAKRLAQVLLMRVRHQSDYQRWTDPSKLEPWWDARTDVLAELVPADCRVIEFGAGRRQLESRLKPGCTYVPSDLVDRGPGTLVCDLNQRPLPELRGRAFDVAVFGGVLEYVVDVPALVDWLAGCVRLCVASYARVEPGASIFALVRDRLRRQRFGYMNHFTEEQIATVFRQRGFSCRERRLWDTQTIFLFERANGSTDRAGAAS